MLFKVHSIMGFLGMLFWNVLFIGLLHVVLLLLCVRLSQQTMDYQRPRFAPKQWEHNGRFYRDKLKINVWKDYIPQYVSKDGFSKESLEKELSLSYVDQFLTETCRGEWYHTANLLGIVFFLLVDPLPYSVLFSLVLLVVHGTCTVIQRYNRFRLLIVRKKLVRDAEKNTGTVSAPVVVTINTETTEKSAS